MKKTSDRLFSRFIGESFLRAVAGVTLLLFAGLWQGCHSDEGRDSTTGSETTPSTQNGQSGQGGQPGSSGQGGGGGQVTDAAGIASGLTAEGRAWKGAQTPGLVIYEYADYECPYCKQGNDTLRDIAIKFKDWLRIVHLHFPLDTKCNTYINSGMHIRACDCAFAGICASKQGSFWPMHERLFAQCSSLDVDGLVKLAGELGLDGNAFRTCLAAPETRQAVSEDVLDYAKYSKTVLLPSYRVGDKFYQGSMGSSWWESTLLSARNAF